MGHIIGALLLAVGLLISILAEKETALSELGHFLLGTVIGMLATAALIAGN